MTCEYTNGQTTPIGENNFTVTKVADKDPNPNHRTCALRYYFAQLCAGGAPCHRCGDQVSVAVSPITDLLQTTPNV